MTTTIRSKSWLAVGLFALALVANACGGGGGSDGGTPDPGDGGGGGAPPPTGDTCNSGQTFLFVANRLNVATPVSTGVVAGFDIDERVSTVSDEASCFHADFTSPPPESTPGIDNQLGPLLAGFGFADDVAHEFAASIEDGELLALVELSHVDDLSNDDCVTLTYLAGLLPEGVDGPQLGADLLLAPGQIFDVARASFGADGTTPLARVDDARIAGGVLDSGLGRVSVSLPVTGLDLGPTFNRMRIRVDGDHARDGVIGGSFAVDQIAEVIGAFFPQSVPIAEPALRAVADLDRDAGGACQALSVGLTIEAVSAVRGVVR